MEAKKNIKTVKLILTAEGLRKFKTIPTFKNSLHPNQINNLHVGTNELNVNHYTSSKLKQIAGYDSDNIQIKEQLNKENTMKLQELKKLIKECYNNILQEDNEQDYTGPEYYDDESDYLGTDQVDSVNDIEQRIWKFGGKASEEWNNYIDNVFGLYHVDTWEGLEKENSGEVGDAETFGTKIIKKYNITESNKMKKSELIKLIKECHGEILKEFAPEPNAHDEDEYTSDIDDKKFKTNKALDKAKEKLDKVNKAIADKFADYKSRKCTPEAYIAFFKEKSKLRKELETELHDLI